MQRAPAMAAFAAAAALALALGGAASAKPAEPDPIVAVWSFKTDVYGPDCTLVGEMLISHGETAGAYTCRFETRETCRAWKVRARQTCQAVRTASGALSISSAVVTSEGASYKPDDFTLDVLGPFEMRGAMSSVYRAPVVFSRKTALTS